MAPCAAGVAYEFANANGGSNEATDNAFESIPSDGVVFETHGEDCEPLSRACEEVINALGLEEKDFVSQVT